MTLPSDQEIVSYTLKAKGYSAKQIAEYTGLHVKTIYRIRDGARPSPKSSFSLISFYCKYIAECMVLDNGSKNINIFGVKQ